jgi:hypothetical protein
VISLLSPTWLALSKCKLLKCNCEYFYPEPLCPLGDIFIVPFKNSALENSSRQGLFTESDVVVKSVLIDLSFLFMLRDYLELFLLLDELLALLPLTFACESL